MMTREIVTNGVSMVPRDRFLAAVCSCRHFKAAGYVFRKIAEATAAMRFRHFGITVFTGTDHARFSECHDCGISRRSALNAFGE